MSLFKAHRLCGETEGWSCAAREEAGDLVLEWREADTGLVRADGEGGAQAGVKIVTLTSLIKNPLCWSSSK